MPSVVLMEHAGRGLATLVAEHRPSGGGDVLVVCGPGNNGGDGYACGRFLSGWGVPVRILRAASSIPRPGDSRLEYDLASRALAIAAITSDADLPALRRALDGVSVVVDALFGIGLSRPLAAPYPTWIDAINASTALRIAADVPSGLDADRGVALPVAVRAHMTAAMGMPKFGCFTPTGLWYCGEVVEIDIGLPAEIHRAYLR